MIDIMNIFRRGGRGGRKIGVSCVRRSPRSYCFGSIGFITLQQFLIGSSSSGDEKLLQALRTVRPLPTAIKFCCMQLFFAMS